MCSPRTPWPRPCTRPCSTIRPGRPTTPGSRSSTPAPATSGAGELSTRSEDFRTRWAAHDVRLHRTGVKQFRHPVVGDLDLHFETMAMTADPGLTMTLLSAPAGSASDDALRMLAS